MTARYGLHVAMATLALASQGVAKSDTPDAAVVGWVAEHAIALPARGTDAALDLRPLVGKARVVSLGEPVHGGRESLLFRNRLFRQLVEQHGFTAIAVESGFVDGMAIDDYVNGCGELTDPLVNGVFSFAYESVYQENRQLLQWMRAYNEQPGVSRKLRFYGLEMARAVGHWMPQSLIAALTLVERIEPEEAARLSARVAPALRVSTAEEYSELTAAERQSLTLSIVDLISLFERRQASWLATIPRLDYERGYRNALNAQALDADVRRGGWWTGCAQRPCDGNQRDAQSAANLRWALHQEGRDGRILVFSHNGHVRKDVDEMKDLPYLVRFSTLGRQLDATLGAEVTVLGTLIGRWSGFHESSGLTHFGGFDQLFVKQRDVPQLLDLRALPATGAIAQSFARDMRITSTEQVANGPAHAFDALVYLPLVTAADEKIIAGDGDYANTFVKRCAAIRAH